MVTTSAIAELNKQFGIPTVATVIAGEGGLSKVAVTGPAASGEIYLHGGHVTSWIPRNGSEVLYCSPHAFWKDGRAIRGGVPICFPWFGDKAGDPSAPAHGFVRTKVWELESIVIAGQDVAVTMFTVSDDDTGKWWPYEFRLVCQATFGAQLRLELTVSNTSSMPLSFEEALHAYFRVGNAETVVVNGLDATGFLDKTDHRTRKIQHGNLRFSAETDSVFLDTQRQVDLIDPGLHRRIVLRKESSLTTVVWNPWAEKSRSMSDLGDGEWKNFVCIEASNVAPYPVQLASGKHHSMTLTIQIDPEH